MAAALAITAISWQDSVKRSTADHGRFSGGTTGLCASHIAPEAVDGGPIAPSAQRRPIRLDVAGRVLDVLPIRPNSRPDNRISVLHRRAYTTGVRPKYAGLVGPAAVWRGLRLATLAAPPGRDRPGQDTELPSGPRTRTILIAAARVAS